MKKKEQKEKAPKRQYDKGQIFVKIMAGVLALLMVAGTGVTLIYALMGWVWKITNNFYKRTKKGEINGNQSRNELGKFL